MIEVCSSNEKLWFIKIRLSSGATNAKLLFLNIRQRNHGDSIACTSPWTRRIAQSVLRFISLGTRESLLLKHAMLYLSLINADNIKWNLSCIQYQSLPDRSAMLARAVAKLYQLTPVLSSVVGSVCLQHWFLCHDVIMCFFLLWLHDRNNFHDVTMCFVCICLETDV